MNLRHPTDGLFDAGSALAEIMISVRNAPRARHEATSAEAPAGSSSLRAVSADLAFNRQPFTTPLNIGTHHAPILAEDVLISLRVNRLADPLK